MTDREAPTVRQSATHRSRDVLMEQGRAGAIQGRSLVTEIRKAEVHLSRIDSYLDTRRAVMLRHLRESLEFYVGAFERWGSGVGEEQQKREHREFLLLVPLVQAVIL